MANIRLSKNYGFKAEAQKLYSAKKSIRTSTNKKKNEGGLIGGLGYVGGNFAAGVGGIGEGLADIVTAAGALIGGDVDYAKYVFKDNVVGDWHRDLTEDYNPGDVMQFIGDVSHGLGQSSVFLLDALGVPVGTVGFFGGMVGQGISNAAEKTGDVGFKEVAYGALSGAAEGVLEKALGGMSKVATNLGGKAFKSITKTAVRKGLVRELLSDAGGEFLEEFASEYIDVGLQRLTGVDKNASTTFKDAFRSGMVGFFSGAISAGSSDVIKYAGNQKAGARIIKSGNAQTVVNTATAVADKLAGAGTDFRHAAEWVKLLRADVDAYNKLKDADKIGLKGQTILGEMQTALGFAETQSVISGVRQGIMKASQVDREAWAEYINQTVEKSKRKKDYTAEDVAANVDEIATQLAILKTVDMGFDLDGAVADAINEAEIADVIEGERAVDVGESGDAAFEEAVARGENNVPNTVPAQKAVDGGVPIAGETAFVQNDEVVAPNRAAPVENIYEEGAESLPYGGVPEARVGTYPSVEELDTEGRKIKYALAEYDEGVLPDARDLEPAGISPKTAVQAEIDEMTVTEADRVAARERTERAAKFEREQAEDYNWGVVSESRERVTEGKDEAQRAESGEGESEASEPKIREAKEILTREQRAERTRERVRKWIEWEKNTAPTVAELNEARSFVKGFDDLDFPRRLAILRMIRSAEGKVDKQTLKGVANLMAARTRGGRYFAGDLEIRFAEGITQRGLYTTAGGGSLIVLNSDGEYKPTLRRTIAHELVHYLETRAGYKSLAEYVKKTAKPERIKEIRKEYEDFYADAEIDYTEADLESEIVASLVGDALQSERFLKRYAEKDTKLIKRIFDYLKNLRAALKDRDPEAEAVAREMALRLDTVLAGVQVRESDGGKRYALPSKKDPSKLDPRTVTREDVYEMLTKAGEGKYDKNTYIPVRISTPAIVIQRIKEKLNKTIPNYPLIMSADKVINAMERKGSGDDGLPNRLEAEEIIRVIEAMSDPLYIVYEPANEEHTEPRYVEVVRFNLENGRKAFAVLELVGEYKNVRHMNERFEGGRYNVFVTVYPPQSFKLNELINNKNNKVIYDKKKDFSQVTSGITVPSVLNDPSFFIDSIHQNKPVVNTSEKNILSGEDQQLLFDEEFYENYKLESKEQIVESVDELEMLKESEDFRELNDDQAYEVNAKLKALKAGYITIYDYYVESAKKRMLDDYAKHGEKSRTYRILEEKRKEAEKKAKLSSDVSSASSLQKKQFEIIQSTNPMYDDFHTGIRSPKEIKTFAEVVDDSDSFTWGDFSREDAKKALAKGEIEVYSSYPIENGVFVSTSYKQALGYAGNDPSKVHAKIVTLDSVAWINGDEGQYANVKSTPAVKKYDLGGKPRRKTAEKKETGEKFDEHFARAEIRAYEREAKEAQNTAEAFKAGNRILNAKLEASRAEAARYRAEGMSLARKIAEDAYETDAKTFTQKEVGELIERINSYSTEKFKDIMNEKSATLSKADKEQFAFDIYVAFHVASADSHAIERIGVLADKLARDYLGNVYYSEDGSRLYLNEIVNEATYEEYVKLFRKKIMASFRSMGRETTHARLTAKYRAEMATLQKKILDAEEKGKNLRELQYQAKKLKTEVDIQKRSPQDEGIYNVEKEMSRIADERGRVSAKQADKAFEQMYVFLTSDSGKVDSALEELAQVEGESMVELIREYKHSREQSQGKYLNSVEMALAAKIIAGGRKILREYNREYYNGHWVDRVKLATDSVSDLTQYWAEKEYKTKFGKLLGEKVGKGIQQVYFYNILSPETVVEALEGYKKNGVLKTLYHAVREATQKAEHMAVKMKKPFAEYLDDKANEWVDEKGRKRSFRDKLNEKVVVVNGNEITLGEAIYLYMLTKREHSHLGLKESGFITYDENNQSKRQFTIADPEAAAGQIDSQLDATDKAFLKMAETFFNETASKIKYDADMKILGYTNNQPGYYVPIIRDRYERMANVTDKRQSIGSIATVYNKSFTQQTIENAKALEGKNVMVIINDHADGLADYSELYLPLKSFDRVYNTRVINDKAQATSIRKVLNNQVWKGSDKYFKKLFADIQGQGEERSTLDDVVGKMRSGWVNSVLGLNLKVVATQTTSFVAANQVIEMKYLAPALAKFVGDQSELGKRADEYSDTIEVRSFEMGAIRAQGNIDRVAKWSEKSGFLINWMDRRVCLAIFHAAELKAEAEGAGAVGTVQNAEAAAKIADEVIYTTQAMTSQAERSQLQRHKSEIARMFAMFTSDSVKQLSHFYGNVMKYVAHKERAKTDATYEAELKKDAKAVGRSATTLVATGVMLGIITQAFKYLYAKEEEEPEDKVKDFAIDMISSTLNILPVVSDVMDKFVFGYDLSLNVLDIANDTIEDTSKLFSMAGKAMSGGYVSNAEVGKNVIGALKTYGTLLGVPISPVERTVTGLLRRFSPATIYGYDALFANPSYTEDLREAVESGDERLAEHILKRLYESEATGIYTSEELGEVARLYKAGYTSVLPQRIGKEVNGVELTRAQRRQFNSIYEQASAQVDRLLGSASFASLTDEQKAKAVKNLYTLYYNRAASEVTGKEWTNAQAYSLLTDRIPELFASQAYKSGLEAYEGEDGKQISVRDQFVDYAKNMGLSDGDYLVIAYANGVRDKETRAAFLSYLNGLTLEDGDKERIAERLGLALKNGVFAEKE